MLRCNLPPVPFQPLPVRDQHYLRAAEGWLDLGDWRAANDELEQVTPAFGAHPQVLTMRWYIYSEARQWESALTVAETLCEATPEDASAWIHRSYVLHELKRTEEAEAFLLPALERFPDEPTIAYNLACYACVLGRLTDARRLLDRAILVSGDHADEVKQMAQEDIDLQALLDEGSNKYR